MNIERQTAFENNNKRFVKAGESHPTRKRRVFRFEFNCSGDVERDRENMMRIFKKNMDAYFRFANQ